MTRRLTFLGFLTAGLLASGAAYAVPVVNVGGVMLPIGNVQISQTDYETQILPTSTTFSGFGVVTLIQDPSDGTQGYSVGGGSGVYLYDEFSNFSIRTIDTSGPDIKIYLTGGELNYYTFSSNQLPTLLADDPASAKTLLTSGNLWLSLTPQPEDNSNDTLIITLLDGSNLQSVSKSTADADLDVNLALNGAANGYFTTCTVTDSNAPHQDCLAGFTDLSFSGGGQDLQNPPPSFPISGTDNLTGVTVPEPISISLFGGGLIGMAALRRRKAKKA